MTSLDRLYQYAENGDIYIFFCHVGFSPAVTVKDGDNFNIAVDVGISNEHEERTCLMHELAHIATGAFYRNDHDIIYRKKMENRADKWLIQLLIDPEDLQAAIQSGYTQPWELAELFDVTEDFMCKAIGFYQTGYISYL